MAESYHQFPAVFSSGVRRQAIAVILSGLGVDGTQGLASIKAAGGVTFAQSPASARYAFMPKAAIDSGRVDFVLPPEEIAHELERIAVGKTKMRPVHAQPLKVRITLRLA